MSDSLTPAQFDLLLRASPSGVTAEDKEQAADLCVLKRLGLLAEHAAGICVLTEAGRRYVRIEAPLRKARGAP